MRNRTPSPALIVAVLALVVALGGTSYAALTIGKNSVGAKQLKANSVRSGKVANGSLLARDFKAGQLPAGAQGAPGAPGAQGAPGPQGDRGPAGPTTGAATGFLDPPTADKTLATSAKTKITTSTAGSLYVSGALATSIDGCSAGADCRMSFGLYVDGNPVAGTKTEVGYAAGSGHGYENLSTAGIAKGIGPGTHDVELKWIGFSGTFAGGFAQNFGNVSAVALGEG